MFLKRTSSTALAVFLWPALMAASTGQAPANLINKETVSLTPASELIVTFPLPGALKSAGNMPTAVNLTVVGPLQPCQRVISNNVGYCENYVLTAFLRGGGAPGGPHTVTVPMASLFQSYLPLEPSQTVVDNTGYLNGVNVMDGFWQAGSPTKSSCGAPTLKTGEYNTQIGCLFGGDSIDLHLMVPGQPAGNQGFVIGVPGFPLSQTILIYLTSPTGSVQAIPQSIVLYQH